MIHVVYLVACVGVAVLVVLGIGLLLERIRTRRGVGWSVLRAILNLIAAIVSVFPF